jgi:preprotein translocase subunit SecG
MIINIVQIIISVLLMLVILIQNRGTGLGAAFGGEGNIYRTKRGAEKFLHIATIVLAVLFLASAFYNLIY